MHLKFLPPFDGDAYRTAKARGKGSHHDKVVQRSTTTSPSSTVDINEEYPPVETLLPVEVLDLTGLPESTLQQIEDGNNHGRETVTHETSTEHSETDLPRQGCPSKDGRRLADSADTAQHSSRDNGRESVGSVSAHDPRPSSQSSNDAAGLPTDAAANAEPTCRESGGTQAAEVSRCSIASPQHAMAVEPNKTPNPSGQATDSHKSSGPNIDVCPELPMDDGEDSILPGEWEGKIIGEEGDAYLVFWENSFIPKGYASAAMIQTWEAKKAKILAGEGKRGVGIESKQRATVKGRVEKRGTGR